MNKTEKTITDNTVNPDILKYTVGDDPVLDRDLVFWDCLGTAAHVRMLSEMELETPIVTSEEACKVVKALNDVIASYRAGQFEIKVSDQDVHMAVERVLTERLGDLGKKIHTGRSRNDQVAVDIRLHIRNEILETENEVVELCKALVEMGRKNQMIPLVGRTHLQPAMPSSVGVWATGHAETIFDQLHNLDAAFRLADRNPLGSAAGYGVPLPLKRHRTTELLGFSSTLHNVFGASMARGECEASLLSALAQLMAVISRLAEDLILFSMPEFAYFKLPREYCTGSSIMPQKFNPDVLELVRSKTAQTLGLSTAALSLLHAMPGGYNRDLQDSKWLYMKGLDVTRSTLRIMAKVIEGVIVNPKKCREAFTPGVFATDVALREVAAGKPWRDAYHDVRDHLERLVDEDPDTAVAAKHHEGATNGLDWRLYDEMIAGKLAAITETKKRLDEIYAKCLRYE